MSDALDRPPAKAGRATACALLIVVFGGLIYSNSLQGPFILDDHSGIINKLSLRQLWPPEALREFRPVANLTLAVNYHLHGLEVRGYHIVNLLIHLTASVLLFGIVRRTLMQGSLQDRFGQDADWLALAVALVWMAHPLQTQSVNYIIQRMESLMGMLYLLTLWAMVRARQSQRPLVFSLISVAACALGMGTKEVMVTAPIMVLLFDRIFLSSSWRDILQKHKTYYAALFGTWLVLATVVPWSELGSAMVVDDGAADSVAENTADTATENMDSADSAPPASRAAPTPLEYALTQPGVITHYLRLSVYPAGQCLDPWWPVATTAMEIVPPAIFIGALLAITFWCLYRFPTWGFVGLWFFMILAPTSTIAPLPDLAFEHRMYLSLATLAVLFVIGGYILLQRKAWGSTSVWLFGVVPVVVLILGSLTFLRNQSYQTTQAVWGDVVRKAPHNPRALLNYGIVLSKAGQYVDGLKYCQEALNVAPDYQQAGLVYLSMGNIYHRLRRYDESRSYYLKALEAMPDSANAVHNLGISLVAAGQPEKALPMFERAIRMVPRSAEYHTSLGMVLRRLGRPDDAQACFQQALKLDPHFARARDQINRSPAPATNR